MQQCPKCGSKSILTNRDYKYFNVYDCPSCQYWTYLPTEECCQKPDEIITIHHKSNGQKFLYKQCLNCGGSTNRNKPLSLKKFGEEIRDGFSEYRFSEYNLNKSIEHKELSERKHEYRKINSKIYKYHIYLLSSEWEKLREKVKMRDGFKCKNCNDKKAEEVHHLTYENILNEKMEDLISVCSECHRDLHKLKNLQRN